MTKISQNQDALFVSGVGWQMRDWTIQQRRGGHCCIAEQWQYGV